MPTMTGGPGCCPCINAHVIVKGCNGIVLPGATVEIYTRPGHVLVASGTTDAAGRWDFTLAAGDYTVEISYTHFATTVYDFTYSGSGAIGGSPFTLAPDADHVCCCGVLPLPKLLYLTTDIGTVTLTAATVGGVTSWTGCQDVPVAAAATMTTLSYDDSGVTRYVTAPCCAEDKTTCVTFKLSCPTGVVGWKLSGTFCCAWYCLTPCVLFISTISDGWFFVDNSCPTLGEGPPAYSVTWNVNADDDPGCVQPIELEFTPPATWQSGGLGANPLSNPLGTPVLVSA
jgi:hypothetical protein